MAFLIEPEEADSSISPSKLSRRRKMAELLSQQGMSTEPIQHWTQGAARLAQALVGELEESRADKLEKEKTEGAWSDLLGEISGGSTDHAEAGKATPSTGGRMPSFVAMEGGAPSTDVLTSIQSAANAHGVDPNYLARLAQIESGMDPQAANPKSSARGLFQFINSTARQYGLADPLDPSQSADAAARLTLDNKKVLQQGLGREPTPGELYLAHQQGGAGALKLLTNPDARAVDIVGQDAIRLNGGSPDMTARDFASKWVGKFGHDPRADLPAEGAVATQGFAVPGGSSAAGRGRVNPALIRALRNEWLPKEGRQIAANLLAQHLKPDELKNIDLGDAVGFFDSRGNLVRQLPKSQKPEYRELNGRLLKVEGGAAQDITPQGLPPGARPMSAEERASFGVPEDVGAYIDASGKPGVLSRGTTVNVDTKGPQKFDEEANKYIAGRYGKIVDAADEAVALRGDIDVLSGLLAGVGTGRGAEARVSIAQMAKGLGLDSVAEQLTGGKLSEMEAAMSIVDKITPRMRVPGSGATSDMEMRTFRNSIPSLAKTPEGNAIIADTFRALYDYQTAAGDIALQALRKEVTQKDADKMLKELPSPFENFKRYREGQKGDVSRYSEEQKSKRDALKNKYGLE